MQNSFRLSVLSSLCGGLLVMGLVGCEKEEPKRQEAQPSTLPSGAPATPPTQAKEAAGTTPVVDCPAGNYLFDYASYNLGALLNPTGQGPMKVLKQTGTANCTISSLSVGQWICSVNEPMGAEISMAQAGLSATAKIEMTGTAALTFVGDAPGSLQVKSTDLSAYKMKASMNLGGKEIPFPMDQMPQLFGNEGTRWHYACTAESLHLKGDVPGNVSVELTMKRL